MDAADDGAEAEEADGVAEAMGDAHLMAGAARPAEEALDAAAPLAVLDVTPGFAALDAAGGQLSRMTKQLPKSVIDFASDATEDEQRILFESIDKCCSSRGRDELLRAAGWQSGTSTEEDASSNEI